MAVSKKPRKKYRPGRNLQDPLAYVLRGVQPAPVQTQTKLRLDMHRAFEGMTKAGGGTVEDWCVMGNALNVARALCDIGSYQENTQDIAEAQAAHESCGARYERMGSFGYSGQQLTDVRFAMTVHEHQLMDASIIHLEQALRSVEAAIDGKKSTTPIIKKFAFTGATA